MLGSLAALIIVIGIVSTSGNAKQADNASAIAITTPTGTATPSRAPTHHATRTGTRPRGPGHRAGNPPGARATLAPAATAPPPPAAATTPADCHPHGNEGTCCEPGKYWRDADHGASGIARMEKPSPVKTTTADARPHGADGRSALPIAGDDEQAKAAVTAFLDSIGYDAVDAGPVAESWRQEPETPAYGTPYGPFSDEAGTPASAAKIHAALVGAHR